MSFFIVPKRDFLEYVKGLVEEGKIPVPKSIADNLLSARRRAGEEDFPDGDYLILPEAGTHTNDVEIKAIGGKEVSRRRVTRFESTRTRGKDS